MTTHTLRSLAVAGLVMLGFAMPSRADTIAFDAPTVTLTGLSAGLQGTTVQGTFFVYWNFTLDSNVTGPLVIAAAAGDSSNFPVNITGLQLEVYAATGSTNLLSFETAQATGLGAPLFGTTTTTLNGAGQLNIGAIGPLNSPGIYTIELSGIAPTGATCGLHGDLTCDASLGGTLSMTPVVPLPGALVLFGSGLVGLVTLGRKRKQKAQPVAA